MNTINELFKLKHNNFDYYSTFNNTYTHSCDCQLIKGDSFYCLNHIDNTLFDVLLTDPPYGINCKTLNIQNDNNLDWLPNFVKMTTKIIKKYCIVFYSRKKQSIFENLFSEHYKYVKIFNWIKVNSNRRNEKILIASNLQDPNNITIDNDIFCPIVSRKEKCFPYQKPIPLLNNLLTLFSEPGDFILDPFMGSGSHIIAALNNYRNACGIEIEPEFYHLATSRISKL